MLVDRQTITRERKKFYLNSVAPINKLLMINCQVIGVRC